MTGAFLFGGGFWLLAVLVLVVAGLYWMAEHSPLDTDVWAGGDDADRPALVAIQHGGGFTYTSASAGELELDDEAAATVLRWALEDGHRAPGADERRARRDVRPRGGLCEIVPIDELRRRRDRAEGDAA